MARNFLLMRRGFLAQSQLKMLTMLMSVDKRWGCSRSVTMRVTWSSLISRTRRDSAARLPDVFSGGFEWHRAIVSKPCKRMLGSDIGHSLHDHFLQCLSCSRLMLYTEQSSDKLRTFRVVGCLGEALYRTSAYASPMFRSARSRLASRTDVSHFLNDRNYIILTQCIMQRTGTQDETPT